MFLSLFQEVLPGVRILARQKTAVCQCVFHDDGALESKWSMNLYDNFTFYCFGCKRHGSIVDLYAKHHHGQCAKPGTKIQDSELKNIYRQGFEYYKTHGHNLMYDTKAQAEGGTPYNRSYTELEQTFLTRVYQIMRKALEQDWEAQAYLKDRACPQLPIFGVARHRQYWAIYDVAEELGDPGLLVSCGLESQNPKYQGRLNCDGLLMAFRFQNQDATGPVTYWQGRALPNSRRKNRYQNPWAIEKRPLIYRPDPSMPMLAAEGIYDVAPMAEQGWGIFTFLGAKPNRLGYDDLKHLKNGVYLVDRDKPESYDPKEPKKDLTPPGIKTARVIYRNCDLSGIPLLPLMPPLPFKDANEWMCAESPQQVDVVLRAYRY